MTTTPTLTSTMPRLTNAQMRLAEGFISRVQATLPNYRLQAPVARYAAMIEHVDAALADPLIAKDYGRDDLVATREYFVYKYTLFGGST